MLKTIPFQDRMEARHSDLNAVQTNTRAAMDNLVKDAVTAVAPGYTGFMVSKNTATELGIAAGRILRTDGAVFEMEAAQTRSITAILPSATKRKVAVIAYGQEEDSRTEVRDFLVDLESDTTEPRTVVVERRRAVAVDLVPGQESATLPNPAIDGSLMVIAWVVLNTTGIESITMNADTALPSVSRNSQRITALETWKTQLEPRLNTIASDITALKKGMSGAAGQNELIAMARDIARLKERLEIPDDASDWGADRFLTRDETDVDNIDLLCLVEEGIRFGDAASNEYQLALFNPLDTNAYMASNGLLLPGVSSKVVRLSTSASPVNGSVPIAQYGFQTHEMKEISVARERLRYGPAYNVCNNSQWWRDGVYDSATNTFTKNGETFLVTQQSGFESEYHALWSPNENHLMLRVQQYWTDTWNDNYWIATVTDRTVGGAQIAQTFLNSQDGWLSGLNLRFESKDAQGDVHISIAKTLDNGAPNPKGLLAHTTIPWADIKVAPTNTYVQLPATFLEAGERYAVIITTLGNHKVVTVNNNQLLEGTLFYSTDGAYFQGDLTKDLYIQFEFLQFKASRVELEMTSMSLSGGISSIDVLAASIKPKSCELIHQVLLPNSGEWKNVDRLTPNLFVGLPTLVRHRLVFVGTAAVAPAIQLPGSRVTLRRQRTTFKHVSTRRTLATSATVIRVDLILSKFESARHSVTPRLKKDDNTYINATGFIDSPIDPDRFMRTFTFNTGTAIPAYKIEIDGTTNNALAVFHVEERIDIAF